MPEQDEADNLYARQFVWYPYTLATAGTWVIRQRPPDAWGGFTWSVFSAPNCDGFTYLLNADPFVGAVMVADNDASDFDLRLHTHTTGPTSGFGYFDRRGEFGPAGGLRRGRLHQQQPDDGVLVRRRRRQSRFRPLRLRDPPDRQHPDAGRHQRELPLSQIEPLALRHFALPGISGTNYGTVTLQVDPAVGPVRMKVLHAGVVHAGLDDAENQTVTDENGFAKVDFTYGGPTQGLIVWQDHAGRPRGRIGPLLGDGARCGQRPGPGAADDGGLVRAAGADQRCAGDGRPRHRCRRPSSATRPATYINVQFRNQDAGTATFFDSMTYLDEVPLLGEQISQLAGFTNRVRNFPYVQTVRGGRHTLSMFPDATDVVAEGDETNNIMGTQYVWSPLALASGASLDRVAPPDPTGGFAAVMAWGTDPTWFNCDGLRTPVPAPAGDNGQWAAVATLPGAASDVDLRLHEKVDSVLQGFRDAHAVSVWGPAESDYVLVNFRATTPRPVRRRRARHQRRAKVTGCRRWRRPGWRNQPAGTYGPFSLAATSVIALHEVWLPAGPLNLTLHNVSGDGIDWGLTPASWPAAVPCEVGLGRHRRPGLDRRGGRRRGDARRRAAGRVLLRGGLEGRRG